MAAGKQIQLLFQLTARLGPNFSQSFKNASKTMKELQNDLHSANQKIKDVSAYTKQQDAVKNSRQRVNELQAEHERLTRKVEEAGEATPELAKKLEANAKALAKAKEKAADENQELKKLGDTLREAGINTDNLSADTKKLQEQYSRLEQTQKKVQEIAGKQAANEKAISMAKTQLFGLTGVITAVGTAIYKGPVENAMEWQSQMQNVATLLDGDVKGRVAELNKQVMRLSNSTGIGTGDLTDGLYQVVSAFGDSAEASAQLEVAAKAAKAGGATTTDAINLLSAVTKGYGDTSAQAQQKAADLSFMTVKLGQTSFPELASSIGQVIPLASTLGTKQEDLFGAMATLTGVTGSTSEVTTQLKATLQAFLSPSAEMAKRIEKLGYASGKQMMESKGLQGALDELKTSVQGDELAFANLFSSVEAKNAVLALAGTQADNFTEKTNQMYEAAGAAQKAFETATDSTDEKVNKAKNSITNLTTTLGSMLLPAVGKAANKIADFVSNASEFAQKNPQVISMAAKLAAGLAGAKVGGTAAKIGFLEVKGGILSLQKAFNMIKGLGITKYIGSMSGGFGGIAAKILPLAGVITAVGGAIYYVSTHLEQVRGFIQKTFGDEGLAVFDKLWGVITQVGGAVKNAFFADNGSGVFGTLAGILPAVMGILQSLLPLLPVITGTISQMLPIIGQIASAVLPVLGGLLKSVASIIASLIAEGLPVLQQLLQALMPVIQIIAQALGSGLVTALQGMANIISSVMQILQGLIDFITGVFTGNWQQAWEGVKNIFGGIVGGLGEIIKAPLNTIVSSVNTVIGGLNKLTVPDWVPGIGGKGINIPLIPGFAAGTMRTPDTFIAGENGPELITKAANRRVFTAAQTQRIFNSSMVPQGTNAADVSAVTERAGTITIHVTNSPNVVINGEAGNVKEQLEQYDESFLERLRELIISVIREQKDREDRVVYA